MVGTVPIASLHDRIFDYASSVHDLRTPSDVLDELHDITTKSLPLPVLGAARFPSKAAGWDSVQLGNSVFLHKEPRRGGGKNIKHWRAASSAPPVPGAVQHGSLHLAEAKQMVEPTGMIGGQTSCSSNMEFATDCLVPSPAGGS
jgi:hypothetical protein